MMMDVEHGEHVTQQTGPLNAAFLVSALLEEVSAITDYRTLRDTLPRRLARLLRCRCVLFYQRYEETLQFISGSFDDKPGWSSALLAVAHINPVSLSGNTLEARAWQQRRAVSNASLSTAATIVATPLLYRMRGMGVLVALRGEQPDEDNQHRPLAKSSRQSPTQAVAEPDTGELALPNLHRLPDAWQPEDMSLIEAVAGVVAMQLENTRLLERDRERIQELSLLNSISRQFHASLRDIERVRSAIIQRTREISSADLCECLFSTSSSTTISWMTSDLVQELLRHFSTHQEAEPAPLIAERPGNASASGYFARIDATVKTFFALPLRPSHHQERLSANAARRSSRADHQRTPIPGSESPLLGLIVGAYLRPRKLQREETTLLSVLANQASAVLENMSLMAEVVEARNEARKLLRQVLDDQRLKELILESIPNGLLTIDLHGHITTCNQAAATLLGYAPIELIGRPLQPVLPIHSLQRVLDSETPQSECITIATPQEAERIVQVDLLPFRNDRGALIGALATLIDMTAVHQLEEEKRRLDRLASLGEMAANVAHEVRNPLASIKTSMQMLLEDLPVAIPVSKEDTPEESLRDEVTVVLKEVERLDAIVRDLLQFSRPRQLHRVLCVFSDLCERVIKLVEQQCSESGVLIHRVYHDAPPVPVDISQMEQVLLNLLLNAVQAMPGGGVLTITQQVIASSSPGTIAHDYLEITVNDTGTGISAAHLERVFQPFFTTRAHGIGLGLPISRRLVEDHQGQLFAESQLGFGATFILRLPLSPGEATGREHEEDTDESL
jgi:PAS domain S-box-containing protein